MLTFVTEGVTTIITWIGTVLTALVTEAGALAPLAPLFAIGIAASAILLGIKVIRGLIWGA